MFEGILPPVGIGLGTGIAFIVLVAVAINPMYLSGTIFSEDQKIIDRTKASKAVQQFLIKHPFAQPEIIDRGNITFHDDDGNVIRTESRITVAYYAAPKTIFDLRAGSPIAQHGSTLYVNVDSDGNIREIFLRCTTFYPDQVGAAGVQIDGEEKVLQWLRNDTC